MKIVKKKLAVIQVLASYPAEINTSASKCTFVNGYKTYIMNVLYIQVRGLLAYLFVYKICTNITK